MALTSAHLTSATAADRTSWPPCSSRYLLSPRHPRAFRCASIPRRIVVIGLVFAAVWHVALLPAPPNDDIYRYVWDGRLQRFGYNPYIVIPSDPAAHALHTPYTRKLNNPYLPSPYPAGAQLFIRIVTAIHESAFSLKVAFVLCDFAIALLLNILRLRRSGPHLVLAYAWSPLLAIEVAANGHIDIVGALFLVVSAAALAADGARPSRRTWSGSSCEVPAHRVVPLYSSVSAFATRRWPRL